jgi:hypothetical protein
MGGRDKRTQNGGREREKREREKRERRERERLWQRG